MSALSRVGEKSIDAIIRIKVKKQVSPTSWFFFFFHLMAAAVGGSWSQLSFDERARFLVTAVGPNSDKEGGGEGSFWSQFFLIRAEREKEHEPLLQIFRAICLPVKSPWIGPFLPIGFSLLINTKKKRERKRRRGFFLDDGNRDAVSRGQ